LDFFPAKLEFLPPVRNSFPPAIFAVLPSLYGQDLVGNTLAHLHGTESVVPNDHLLSLVRKFRDDVLRSLFGLWVALALAIMAACFLKPPAGQKIRFGLVQAEWFTLGYFMTAVACIAVSRRFFLHYSLLLLPAFPLIFNALTARPGSLKSKRWDSIAVIGLSVLVAFYQWKLTMKWRPEVPSVQHNAELVRAACPDTSLPVVVHGWDFRYYIALGSYPSIAGMDIIKQAGYPPKLMDAYVARLRNGSSLIIDVVNPNSGWIDHDVPKLDALLGSSASKYRRIAVAPSVTVYCPKAGN
jgi:hypothetical protein